MEIILIEVGCGTIDTNRGVGWKDQLVISIRVGVGHLVLGQPFIAIILVYLIIVSSEDNYLTYLLLINSLLLWFMNAFNSNF